MNIKLVLKACLIFSFPLIAGAATEEFDFMGKEITLKSKDKKDLESLVKKMNSTKDNFFKGLDNKCLYKNEKTEECRAEIEFAFQTKIKMKDIASEARKKYYPSFEASDVQENKNLLINALSMIDDSKSVAKKPWQMNYYGQFFQSEGSKKSIHLSSPLMNGVSFVKIDNFSGWAVSQTSDVAGGPTLTKGRRDKRVDSDFMKIALFAGPEFSGARLYGWSKALMMDKGLKLLKNLEKNKDYKGKWGYAYFDNQANLVCSKNMNCDLENKTAKANW